MPCVIPYAPRPLQLRFHEERTRFCVLLCHRRFGKTVAAVNDLIREALRRGDEEWRAAYAAPYLGQAKAVAWDYLRRFAGAVTGTRFLESELACILPNGARIRLVGTENAHALRGLYLNDLVLDEPADMERQVWSQVFRPMLADREGRALFCGTPRGADNLLHDVWQEAGADGSGLWSRFRFPASATGYLPEAELAAARRAMEESEYRQEFECSFAAALRGAYYAALLDAAESGGRVTRLAPDPGLPVHTAWDLGMDDATAIWFFQAAPGGVWRLLDYYEAAGEGLAHYARVLALKARPAGCEAPADLPGIAGRGFVFGQHIAPRDIRVRELGTGQSRLESAAALGIRFSVAPGLSLADGIDATRRLIPRLWIDAEHCAQGLRALRAYRRQWRSGGEAAGPLHDWTSHAADALRYAATGFRPDLARGLPAPGRAHRLRHVRGHGPRTPGRERMNFSYRPAVNAAERDEPFHRMEREGLLRCAMYAFAEPTLHDWRRITARGLLLRCEDAAGRLLACGLFTPWRGNLLEFDFTTFRESAALAPAMAAGGFAWIFRETACAGIAGICPVSNRHAWRLAEACGFRVLGRLPGACFYARKGRHVDGVLVSLSRDEWEAGLASSETKEEAMGFGGGMGTSAPSVPEVTPAPKQEVAKPATEGATAARQNQRDKAARAAGISGSVFTSPLARARGEERKTLLGQ